MGKMFTTIANSGTYQTTFVSATSTKSKNQRDKPPTSVTRLYNHSMCANSGGGPMPKSKRTLNVDVLLFLLFANTTQATPTDVVVNSMAPVDCISLPQEITVPPQPQSDASQLGKLTKAKWTFTVNEKITISCLTAMIVTLNGLLLV